MFSSMPRFFLHHQIDLAQRDGKKILLSMITAVSRLLCLDFDFPENYTHINQVVICLEHILPSTLTFNSYKRCHTNAFFNSATFRLWAKWTGLKSCQLVSWLFLPITMIMFLDVVRAALISASRMTWKSLTKWLLSVWIMFASFMTEKMLHACLHNRPTHSYSWAATMQQTKPRTTFTSLGWSIMSRRIMDCKPSSKISLLNSTGKVIISSSWSGHSAFWVFSFTTLCGALFKPVFYQECGMQKEVVEKPVQKARHCMGTKSTQPTICTLTSSSTTLQLRTHIMRRYIKLTSASSITSLVELSWHTIHAGNHSSCNFYHCCLLTYYF